MNASSDIPDAGRRGSGEAARRPPAPRPEWAYFLDVDGTLLDLAPRPDAVRVEADLRALLKQLAEFCGGAVALISGRAIADIDRLFAPLALPVAGQHGAERRDAAGRIQREPGRLRAPRKAREMLARFAREHPGVLLEDKEFSLALHYRQRPEQAQAVRRFMQQLSEQEGLCLQEGKMVLELKPCGRDKGDAILRFIGEAPFRGRPPVFIGDDATDEDGFRSVNRLDGYSVKVGDGASAARWRLSNRTEVLRWLAKSTEAVAGDE